MSLPILPYCGLKSSTPTDVSDNKLRRVMVEEFIPVK